MPVVTIDPAAVERFELKTAPANPNDPTDENGWVQLRALPYGMKLTRRDKATRMSMRTQQPQRGKQVTEQDVVTEFENYSEWQAQYDFSYCIVDHNLTDANKNKLNFSNPMSLKLLDPRVGSEIERLINSLNEEEDELMLEDFPQSSNILSSNGQSDLSKEESSETEMETF
jgi:hypothetical protein